MYKTAPFIFSILLVLTGCSKGLNASDKDICEEYISNKTFDFSEFVRAIGKIGFGSISNCRQDVLCNSAYLLAAKRIYSDNASKTYPKVENTDLKEAFQFIAEVDWPSEIRDQGIALEKIESKRIAIKEICSPS
jgi:hypothetical protein